jgi:hypothetical protein
VYGWFRRRTSRLTAARDGLDRTQLLDVADKDDAGIVLVGRVEQAGGIAGG